MYKISTFFTKIQLPRLTVEKLMDFYIAELQNQGVDRVTLDVNKIIFFNDKVRITLNRYATKFSYFSKGNIVIEETDNEFIVLVNGSLSNIFVTPAVCAGIATIALLFVTGLDIITFATGLLLLCFMMTMNYLIIRLRFPAYFSNLRLDIERNFQEGH
jgi:hypothetical protein